ncbi:DNA-(apurinic or apyrimidinic site) endonuclease 2 isoform X1 [Lycium barbarum]|uniref:DNA-(apurinic or apyrimidinic site) endonuclease 2 isoform X1 n=1 Tax=Lycium barbarum TaxID=112863 RepID=UPI00293E5A4B|nr:DNA-(apurinic or apyrimidinic site) endonuclease 2 isoform X1 [Lycium barbarum]
MKIVTYNVNGLRPRIQQYGSLKKLLDSLDADIICFQETKLSKHDLRADLVRAEGYESFFSCTRTNDRGRSGGYSGVATFCRVKSAFLSNEVALPIYAEEGFTGLLATSKGYEPRKEESPSIAEGLECFSRDELLKIDSEGRCLITDHGHFVLFNLYGPRAVQDDSERIQFKLTFYKLLERRWECLLLQGRRIIIVGDLNIAPAAIDRCDAEPDFEKNGFRRWFRSLLVQNGGRLLDVFRAKHPDRNGAYTCWSQSTGAEEFNFGSRIDHILSAGSCLHDEENQEGHDFVTCHVAECDILMQFQRWKPGNTPRGCVNHKISTSTFHRWKGGRSIKLEGSDHVPVYTSLVEIPEVMQHSTPSLSTRYHPQVCGSQQTLVSMFTRRQTTEQVISEESESPQIPSHEEFISTPEKYDSRASHSMMIGSQRNTNILPGIEAKKKARHSQGSQLTLNSFFQKRTHRSETCSSRFTGSKLCQTDISYSQIEPNGVPSADDESGASIENTQKECQLDACDTDKEKRKVALQEWQRIHQLMQNSVPLCKGHQEPCVPRVVKKAGPNLGRRFYVCARAEGPSSNPEANCGYFKWAAVLKSKGKGK